MTFQEAKQEADRIGGVVDWWWIYSVYHAEEWEKFNGSHGYGIYTSKGAEKYFHDRYEEQKRAYDKKLEALKEQIRLRNAFALTLLVKLNAVYLILSH